MSGVVLGFVALIWVATRPSQSPQARMLRPSTTSSREGLPTEILPPSLSGAARPGSGDPSGESLPASPIGAQPSGAFQQSSAPPFPVADRATPSRPEESDQTRYEREEKITTTRFHIVRPRETLSAIAKQYYGSPNRWPKILEANRDILKDPNKITPGAKLTIPD
ncbi:MAG: LysM peptidoglycan-binding domain-containing protein [Planctomycetota bacterium]